MSLKSILFPLPSPEQIKSTLPGVARIANTLRADLTLMRIIDPFREGGPKPDSQELKLAQLEARDLDHCRIHVHAHSDPAMSIVQYARDQGIDAIFLPFQPTGLRAVFSRKRSLTKKLLDQSPCPIWLINPSQHNESQHRNIRRVLCAVSGRDLHVLKTAAEVSKTLNARLFLLHVIPEIHEGTLALGFDNHVALSVENALELLAGLQGDAGTAAQPVVQIGPLRDTINRVAQSLNIDLIVTGRRQSKISSFGVPWQGPFVPAPPLMTLQRLIV